MLDNQELQLLSYDQAINKIITNLAQDQSLIDKISALVGEEAVAEQIKEKTDALQNQIDTLNGTVSGHTTSLADIATYVNKDSGLNANSKKVVNVLDGDVSDSSTDAVNGKQLFATKTELTSSIEAKDSAMNTRMVAVEGYVKAEGLDANNKKVINVADGEIAADNKEAINGGQLYTVKTTLEAADTAIQESVTTLEENVTTNHEALAGRVTAVETYVKETGIDANSKKVVNVADATLEADNKDAVNGGQLFTVDAAYKAADISLQGNIDTLSETVESYHTELDDKIDGVDAKVDTNIADIAKLKAATVTIKVPKVHVDSFNMTGEAQTVFTLTAVPNEVKVMANINGIVYEEDTGAFTVDREQKTVTWAFGAGAGGFDLKNDIAEKVVIRYMVDEDVVATLTIA